MRPGMIQLEIGVQSTNPEVVREIRRKMDFDRVARVVRRLSENHNVHLHLDLIAGLPLEDFASFAAPSIRYMPSGPSSCSWDF